MTGVVTADGVEVNAAGAVPAMVAMGVPAGVPMGIPTVVAAAAGGADEPTTPVSLVNCD
jgi:hypothetical protein